MIDRQNTIDNLEQNIRWIEEIECHQFPGWGNVTMAMRDAAELLKEQEPVKPKAWVPKGQTMAKVRGYYCPVCDTSVVRGDRFCHWCGGELKWD